MSVQRKRLSWVVAAGFLAAVSLTARSVSAADGREDDPTISRAAAALGSHNEVTAGLWSKAASLGVDLQHFATLLDATTATLIDTNPGLGADYPIWVVPSRVYPETYSRDSFWTLAGYGRSGFLKNYVEIFSKSAQNTAWSPLLNGQIPTFVRKHVDAPSDARRADESTMFWIIGAKLVGKTVADEPYLKFAYTWLKSNVTQQGFALVSHGWIDAWEPVSTPVVSANNQGLYAVSLRALRDMGVAVDPSDIAAAESAYRSLYMGGYMHAYLGSDVVDVSSLMGEALSLYLWDQPILTAEAVKGTVAKFSEVYYRDGDFLGFKCLSNPNGTYLNLNDFWTIAERDPGNYQNGGSWMLYEELAMYAAARHSSVAERDHYLDRFVRRIKSETKYEDSSKEFICTGGICGGCDTTSCLCPDGICSVGTIRYNRSGYGWNTFVNQLMKQR